MLSLGGGTQSTVMALLADEGRFGQRPDVAVFADTGWEPDAVYDNIGWLVQQLSYPVVTVTADPDRSLTASSHRRYQRSGPPVADHPRMVGRPRRQPGRDELAAMHHRLQDRADTG